MSRVQSCLRCGADNPAAARFCMGCGLELQIPERARFRRRVTMMFADLVGSTSLGERLDPEALSEILTAYFDNARRIIHRHGGTPEKFIGDAVVAVFGLPLAHEDDALRAVRTAVEIQDYLIGIRPQLRTRHGIELRARIGINTGEVAGGGHSLEHAVIFGDTANTAARIEQNAQADEVLIGPTTEVLVRDRVILAAGRSLSAKGKAGEVMAYAVLGFPGEAARWATRGPFVGREPERARLRSAYLDAVTTREPVTVTVLGEPGVGKSRLLAEFVAELGAEVRVLTGVCLPYGDGITYWPIAGMVRAAAQLTEDTPADLAHARLAALLGSVADAPTPEFHALAALLGISDRAVTADQIAAAASTLVSRLAERGPVVLIVDDVQWAEPTLLTLLAELAGTGGTPLLLVLTGRPEVLDRLHEPGSAGWPAALPGSVLHLAALDGTQSRRMLEELLGPLRLEQRLQAHILATAGGNPLFLSQIVRLLLEEGMVDRVGDQLVTRTDLTRLVPAGIHALLTARIDQLPAAEAALLCRAAVIGAEMDVDDLAFLLHDGERADGVPGAPVADLVARLVDRGLLVPRDALGVRFAHLLVRDVAYEQLTKAERARLHERFGRRLAQAPAGLAPLEYDEIAGHHLEQAVRYRSALGEPDAQTRALAELALDRLWRAGRRALARQDAAAAATLLGRALALDGASGTTRPALRVDLGLALLDCGRLADARDQLTALDPEALPDELTRALAEVAVLELRTHQLLPLDVDAVHERSGALMEHFAGLGYEAGELRAGWIRFLTSMIIGRSAPGRAAVERLQRSAGRLSAAQRGRLPGMVAMNLVWSPTPVSDALPALHRLAVDASDNPAAQALVLGPYSYTLAMNGDLAGAREVIAHLRRELDALGLHFLVWSAWAQAVARVELLAGDAARAVPALREGLAGLTTSGDDGFRSTVAGQLGLALARLGRVDEAMPAIQTCRDIAAPHDVMSQVLWRLALSEVRVAEGAHRAAVDVTRQAVGTALTSDWTHVHGDTWLAHARALAAAGDAGAAAAAAGRAEEAYAAKGCRPGLAHARALLALTEVAAARSEG